MPRTRSTRRPAAAVPARRAAAIRRRLLAWYAAHRRSLPWRRSDPDPYRVWVAEIMLQQTQVAYVVPFYKRFVARFPDPAALAAADEEEVLALWSGLGYYSRARNLLRTARIVMQMHGGGLPQERSALEALPGIGAYTAGAILSIAFGQPEPVVDGNVRRVLSRVLMRSMRGRLSTSLLESQARALVSGAPPAELNQAMMELGALICRPSSPSCPSCPLGEICTARRHGAQDRVPPPRRRRATIRQMRAVALISHNGRILLERSEAPGAPRGLWDLPGTLVPDGLEPRRHLERHLRRRGLDVRVGDRLASVEHGITYRRIQCAAFKATLHASRLSETEPGAEERRRWVERSRLGSVAMGSAAKRLLASSLQEV